MPSLMKSEYRHQQERIDGGPYLIVDRFSGPDLLEDMEGDGDENGVVYVRFTDVHPDKAKDEDIRIVLIL